jgi:hypothetical protein
MRATLAGLLLFFACTTAWAQPPGTPPPPAARAAEPFDLTGYWVSLVTQQWRFRMAVPQRGDYVGFPINLKARQFADAWSRQADEGAGKQCEAYGAAAIMRVPTRLHISWEDPDTLRVDTDAGMQTRLLRFKPAAAEQGAPPSWQGLSTASWSMWRAPLQFGPPQPHTPRYGTLRIVTTRMLPGLLRKNGLPYSAQTTLTEDWDMDIDPEGDSWLTVTTDLQDPTYLRTPAVYNSIFEKEPDGSKWDPTACTLD